MRTWHDATIEITGLVPPHDQQDIVLSGVTSRPATLLRTLCWWSASAVVPTASVAPDFSEDPVGFFLEDAFSHNNPGPAHTGDSPWSIEGVDTVLCWFSGWDYSPYAVPRHTTGNTVQGLPGIVNYHLDHDVDKLGYISASGFIDSKAQREWFAPNPVQFTFNTDRAGFSAGGWIDPQPINFWARLRFLVQTF